MANLFIFVHSFKLRCELCLKIKTLAKSQLEKVCIAVLSTSLIKKNRYLRRKSQVQQ